MSELSRFHKERALRAAGREIAPYPRFGLVAGKDPQHADRIYLDACNRWEDDIDAQYQQLLKALPPFQPTPDVQEFADRCSRFGLTAGLMGLNGRVAHRYTALYQLDRETLKNIVLVDKAGEVRPQFLAEVPLGDSFCQFVMRDGTFLTSNSANEDRLDGHPYKGVMVSYHGVPVIDATGELFGTLCHFDVTEQPFSDEEFAHLQGVARVIGGYLPAREG